MKKNIISKIGLVFLTTSLCSGNALMVMAADSGLDRNASTSYADDHCDDPHPNNDCAHFVSECIYHGGYGFYSYSSTALYTQLMNAPDVCEPFIAKFDGNVYVGDLDVNIEPADVCFFHCEKCGYMVHSTIVASVENGYLHCYSHSRSNDGSNIYSYGLQDWDDDCKGDIDYAVVFHWLNADNTYTPISYGHSPEGDLDLVESRDGGIQLISWAYDEDQPDAALQFAVYWNGDKNSGAPCTIVSTNDDRDDVLAAFPKMQGNWHGYQGFVDSKGITGQTTAYIYALGVGDGGDTLLGVETVNIPAPTASFDAWVDSSEIELKTGESKTVTLHFSEGVCDKIYPYVDGDIGINYGTCTVNSLPVTISGNSEGRSTLRYEFNDINGRLLDEITINVNVTKDHSYSRDWNWHAGSLTQFWQ